MVAAVDVQRRGRPEEGRLVAGVELVVERKQLPFDMIDEPLGSARARPDPEEPLPIEPVARMNQDDLGQILVEALDVVLDEA